MPTRKEKPNREYQSVDQFVQEVFPQQFAQQASRPEETARKLGLRMANSILKEIKKSPRSS